MHYTIKTEKIDSFVLAKEAVKVLIERKGLDIKLFDVRENSPFTDFYINVTGRSSTHVASLSDNLADELLKRGVTYPRIEGKRGDSWILIDYRDVIVNVFDRQSREFYNLDRLLPLDGVVDISPLIKEVDDKFSIDN